METVTLCNSVAHLLYLFIYVHHSLSTTEDKAAPLADSQGVKLSVMGLSHFNCKILYIKVVASSVTNWPIFLLFMEHRSCCNHLLQNELISNSVHLFYARVRYGILKCQIITYLFSHYYYHYCHSYYYHHHLQTHLHS